MRCICCNHPLSDVEATRKFKESGTYTEMCDRCLKEIPEIQTITRSDLYEKKEYDGNELDHQQGYYDE